MGKTKKGYRQKKKSEGLFGSWFSTPLRERYCQECGRPHLGAEEPIPTRRFVLGNVEVQMFQSFPYGRLRRELKVQCWNRYRDQWHPQSVYSVDDLYHLAIVVNHVLRLMKRSNSFNKKNQRK